MKPYNEDIELKKKRLEEAQRLGIDYLKDEDFRGCNQWLQTIVRASVSRKQNEDETWHGIVVRVSWL